MATMAERLQQTASSSGAAVIETKLNDTKRLHSFLLEELENYSGCVKEKVEKWDTINTRIQDLSMWMDTTEGKLEVLKKNESIGGQDLSDIKVLCLMVQNRNNPLQYSVNDRFIIIIQLI